MLRNKVAYILAVAAIVGLGFVGEAFSQRAPRDPNQPRGQRDPNQFRQQMADRMKQALEMNDEEYKAVQPMIDKVQTLSRDLRGGGMGGMFGGGGRGGPGGGQPADATQSDIGKKAADLQKLLDNKDSKPEDVKAALTAYRDARDKVKAELEKAQKELREVLTVKREARLVLLRVLD